MELDGLKFKHYKEQVVYTINKTDNSDLFLVTWLKPSNKLESITESKKQILSYLKSDKYIIVHQIYELW